MKKYRDHKMLVHTAVVIMFNTPLSLTVSAKPEGITVLNWYNNNVIVKIFIIGWAILIVALIVNGVASKVSVDTWYSFATEISKAGFNKAFLNTSLLTKVFLFILYPLILGVSAWITSRILQSN